MDVHYLSTSPYGYDFARLGFLIQLLKLPFFLVIVDGCDSGRNHNSNHDCDPLNPCYFSFLVVCSSHFNCNRNNTCNNQNSKCKVFECCTKQFTEPRRFFDIFFVTPECFLSESEIFLFRRYSLGLVTSQCFDHPVQIIPPLLKGIHIFSKTSGFILRSYADEIVSIDGKAHIE